MTSAATKVGHFAAKCLNIKLDYREYGQAPPTDEKMLRGESVFSISSADNYVEREPTVLEWFGDVMPTRAGWIQYFLSLFPFTHWIHRYNVQWFMGDLVAGITIGAVVVPQGMAYAQLAELPVQFGLYSAFMGTLVYWVFATSKDITIGPVAVMSTVVGDVVNEAAQMRPDIPGHVVASALAIILGAIVCFLGFVRLGFIVDFISLTAISAFITGSAFYIAMGQIPGLLGISKKYVDSRGKTYKVVIGVLQNLHHAKLDAAIGITALLLLYTIKYTLTYLAQKYPSKKKLYFFLNTLRTVFVILLYTMISWLVNRTRKDKPSFKTLGTVPRGFTAASVPSVDASVIKLFTSKIPVSVIVLLIEHIAIAKSFGRINNYTINPSQELIGIGVTNLLGPFLGAYPATGSFSRTAIKSKAGVRTPLAGIITSIVVLLAIYALTAVFFYIPSAALSAVIIHAVLDLIMPANTLYQFWRVSPLEVPIFLIGVLVTVFVSIETGVYCTVAISAAMLLFRVAKARGRFLGTVKVHSVVGDYLAEGPGSGGAENPVGQVGMHRLDGAGDNVKTTTRSVYLPIDHLDGSNPNIEITRPYPGIFVYRFSEGYNYPNASHYLDYLTETIFATTRRTDPSKFQKPGDRPWNNPGPKKGHEAVVDWSLPTLKAIILDFSSVNNVDVTSVQTLIDVRNQLDRYATPDPVEWHFACITNRWTKRALAAAGFGYPTPSNNGEFRRWKPLYSVAEMGGDQSAAEAAEQRYNERSKAPAGDSEAQNRPLSESENSSQDANDLNRALSDSKAYNTQTVSKVAVVHGLNRPLFHIDITSALQSAIAHAEEKLGENSEFPRKGYGTING